MPVDGLSTDFDLDAAVTVSELRRATDWIERLRRYGKLRVERRGHGPLEVVGVLVLPEVWRAVTDLIAQLDEIEEREVARLIDHREGARLVSGAELVRRVRTALADPTSRPSE